jgi:predicted transposase YdaD
VIDTSFEEGKAEGREEGRAEIARQMKLEGDSAEKIARVTGLAQHDIEQL